MVQFYRCATLVCVLAFGPAHAHHGISNWDLNKDVTVSGTLTRLEFINPHSWLHVAVKGAGFLKDGDTVSVSKGETTVAETLPVKGDTP